jgi:hypothetical protein
VRLDRLYWLLILVCVRRRPVPRQTQDPNGANSTYASRPFFTGCLPKPCSSRPSLQPRSSDGPCFRPPLGDRWSHTTAAASAQPCSDASFAILLLSRELDHGLAPQSRRRGRRAWSNWLGPIVSVPAAHVGRRCLDRSHGTSSWVRFGLMVLLQMCFDPVPLPSGWLDYHFLAVESGPGYTCPAGS